MYEARSPRAGHFACLPASWLEVATTELAGLAKSFRQSGGNCRQQLGGDVFVAERLRYLQRFREGGIDLEASLRLHGGDRRQRVGPVPGPRTKTLAMIARIIRLPNSLQRNNIQVRFFGRLGWFFTVPTG